MGGKIGIVINGSLCQNGVVLFLHELRIFLLVIDLLERGELIEDSPRILQEFHLLFRESVSGFIRKLLQNLSLTHIGCLALSELELGHSLVDIFKISLIDSLTLCFLN